MLSILHPEPEIDPKIRKKIRLLTLLMAGFWICTAALLLTCLLVPGLRRRLSDLVGIGCGVASVIGAAIYRLRNPRRT